MGQFEGTTQLRIASALTEIIPRLNDIWLEINDRMFNKQARWETPFIVRHKYPLQDEFRAIGAHQQQVDWY